MTDWWLQTDRLLAKAWTLLARGVTDRLAAARHPVLATVSPEGWADARTVVLRGAVAESALLTVHTDSASDKVAALRANPRCALLVWDAKAQLQIRIRARARITPGDAKTWAELPDGARQVYGGTPPSGTSLSVPENHVPGPDLARFAVLDCQAEEIDLLHLGRDRHRRARYARVDGWHGQWIAP
ncbi:MAG: pyridoxamine 5'-phosphate oxidase family protein [Rhodobacteraceae bacterium]|nr:pyridoxamine 5'-phosphate oxidase family protein [Paracoccaceae bacterium]